MHVYRNSLLESRNIRMPQTRRQRMQKSAEYQNKTLNEKRVCSTELQTHKTYPFQNQTEMCSRPSPQTDLGTKDINNRDPRTSPTVSTIVVHNYINNTLNTNCVQSAISVRIICVDCLIPGPMWYSTFGDSGVSEAIRESATVTMQCLILHSANINARLP